MSNILLRGSRCACLALAIGFAVPVSAHAASAEAASTLSIGAVPAWVTEEPDAKLGASTGTEKDGEVYLLVDQQVNVATAERYYRIVSELRTPEAVQEGSTVIVDYDPAYERLVFHRIDVVRDGARSPRLSRAGIQLLRRETSLEFQMLDGTVSAAVVMQDVRPGDRVDVAYTVRGFNPALGGRYVDEFVGGWGTPVGTARVRILSPRDRPLGFRAHAGATEPVGVPRGPSLEYRWDLVDVPAILGEDQAPPWHLDAPWLQVSEFAGWAEVGRWARSLFPPARLPSEMEALVADWRARHSAEEDRALAAVDWVQRNIRYVGIELGTGSYRPSPPATVAERRFGDCKDQVYLLCTVLRRMGIEAAPVMVSTWARRSVAGMLPSPLPFDHVIVRLVLGGRPVLVDPTQSSQRGPLADRFLPGYGHGLLAAEGREDLLPLGPHQGITPETEVVERIEAGGRGEPSLLTVVTTARGGDADDFRWHFAGTRLEEIAASYLDYYASRYPGIESAGEIATEDDESGNVFRVTERYRVPEFWIEDNGGAYAELYADSIAGEIPGIQEALRTAPLWISYPHRVVQRMEVELPEDWPRDSGSETYVNAAFTLRVDHAVEGRLVTVSWDYQALAEEVTADQAGEVQKSVRELDPALSFELTWGDESAGDKASPVVLAVGIGALALAIAAAALAYLRVARHGRGVAGAASPSPSVEGEPTAESAPTAEGAAPTGPAPPTSLADERLRGIGGWLIPVALGLFARPLLSVYNLVQIAPALTEAAWGGLTDPSSAAYHPMWAPVLLFEVAANVVLAVASILLAVLFFQRRRAFPAAFIAMLVTQVIVYLVDVAFSSLVPGEEPETAGRAAQLAVSTITSSVAWILYLLRSRRVKLTFVR